MLPVTASFRRPSRAELLTIGGCAVLVASVVAWVRTTAPQPPPAPDLPPPLTALLEISSTPNGASVFVDGQAFGTTQRPWLLEPGQHALVVRAQDAIDERRTVDVDTSGSSLAVSLWRTHPIVTYLKPSFAGRDAERCQRPRRWGCLAGRLK